MNAEIIAVGSELLLGQIDNTNGSYLSRKLSEIGINVYFHQVVGDNEERLREALQTAESRADIILLTGGLGPTEDDMTRTAVSNWTGVPLQHDEEAVRRIQAFYDARGREVTENNWAQALVLEGAEVLQNDEGLACGCSMVYGSSRIVLLPGPPRELQPMTNSHLLPLLQGTMEEQQQIQSQILRFYEIGESTLTDEIKDIIEAQTNPTVAPLASDGEVSLRLTVKGPSPESNQEMLDDMKMKILDRVGSWCYSEGGETMEALTTELLRAQKKTVSSAESLTGGAFADMMTAFPGASEIFPGGIVCYSNEAKQEAVGVSAEILEKHGAVSAETAEAMAEGARRRFHADYGVSFTGAAGPDPLEGYQPGEMFIGIAGPEKTTSYFAGLGGSRSRIRMYAVKHGLYLLFQELRKNKGG
ncbi:competence/damage-inducible protein A [Alkalicoccus chagannorensis]|uniref:competence/damage-inducible protein A n=1 Tax=Alkalicoccus chagannorensis TaxID=427072 RepID=UPI0003F8F620|nr:competence/damage-inducible protein A [Alkalicoccus chagannorensis]